jgi:hypothetical protein
MHHSQLSDFSGALAHFAFEQLHLLMRQARLTEAVRAWRPKSGHLYFGAEGQEKLFAWLPSVPNGLARPLSDRR